MTEEEKKTRRRAAASAGGRALVAKRGPDYMREIGAAGYFATGSKYGWEFVNNRLFGVHLPTANARRLLRSRAMDTQPRFYLAVSGAAE
jgi:hypothetical protein